MFIFIFASLRSSKTLNPLARIPSRDSQITRSDSISRGSKKRLPASAIRKRATIIRLAELTNAAMISALL